MNQPDENDFYNYRGSSWKGSMESMSACSSDHSSEKEISGKHQIYLSLSLSVTGCKVESSKQASDLHSQVLRI